MNFLIKGEKNYKKAKLYIQEGNFTFANYHIKMALKKDFSKGKLYLLKGIIELYKMDIAKAFETFQRVLTFSNKNPDVYYYIGKCFRYFGNDEEAFDYFIKCYINSNNELIKGKSLIELNQISHIDNDKLEEIVNNNYKCLVKLDKDLDEDLRSKAVNEIIEKNYIKATEILTTLVKKQPRNFEAFKDMAFAFSQMENYDLALKSLKKAKSICKNDKTIHYDLAKTYFKLKNYYEARAEMKKAIKYFPPHFKNFYNMGNICSLIGRTTDAVGFYKKSIEINESFYNAYFNMATIYHSEGMLDDGEKHYKLAQLNAGNKPEIHYNLGLLKYFQRNYFEALNHMLQASKLDPGYENALHNFKVVKNIKMLHQDQDFNEAIPFNTKVLVTFIGILIFLIIAYIVRILG